MKAILCKTNEKPKVIDIPQKHSYVDIAQLLEIDSPIDCVERRINGKCYDFWVDDEGLLKDTKWIGAYCQNATEVLCGNILIALHDGAGNMKGLTQEQIDDILNEINWISNEQFIMWSKNHVVGGKYDKDGNYYVGNDIYMNKNGYLLTYKC